MTTTARDTASATPADQTTVTAVPGLALVVLVNGERQRIADGTSVAAVVDTYAPSRSGIAVARNREVVPRSRWEDTAVAEGDNIEIVTAVAGG